MRVTIAILVATLAATTGLMTASGPAGATTTAATTSAVAESNGPDVPAAHQPGFFEDYRGHHIMGWGRDQSACAYIDGIQLVLYPSGNDRYLSALQAFKEEHGVRNITKASVRVLGDLQMNPPLDAVEHCPRFVPRSRPGQ